MANIAITNYCNLKCPYCFAEDLKHDTPKNMSLEEYQRILDFLKNTKDERVGIIGGEPTLHPQFKEILNLTLEHCKKYEVPCILFTNGLYLAPYISQLAEMANYITILINCNEPAVYSEQDLQKFNMTLDIIKHVEPVYDKTIFGCNIYLKETEYNFLWHTVTRMHKNNIRLSIAVPGGEYYPYRYTKNLYYSLLKVRFMHFIQQAKKLNIRIELDCNYIPDCYFTEAEQQLIREVCNNFYSDIQRCPIPIDILSDTLAIPCFGNYQPIKYMEFDNIEEVRTYFLYKTDNESAQLNNADKCATCKKFEHYACQGGCLAFSEKNRTPS